jgi:molybdenum cofactor cytidylyltransferase
VTGIIILAAGASSRMGQPKQLLPYQQQTLLQRAIQAAVAVPNVLVIVVVGANQTLITPNVNNSSVILEYNSDWQQGMASSIRVGIKRLVAEHPTVQNALLMLCDQPFVDTAVLQRLIDEKLRSNSRIVASAYQNTMGAPVLFDQSYFTALMTLQGQEGAKKLLSKYKDQVIGIPFEKGAIDIDTPADYERLLDLE